jgi:DNA-binding CsgD family transcriptional regulator/tetratricopeptide (TPR) repeat protein
MNERAGSPVLVGRGEYLATLDAALARARNGEPSTVLIGGEAGIGKTRLIGEFTARATNAGTRVLIGACLDLGAEGLPFAPFSAMLRELVRDMGADGVAALLPGHATREVARLLPEFGVMESDTDASVTRARLFEQILALLERLADERPVMLVIEDAHWADRSTRDLLAFLVGSQQVLDRVLIAVTFRSDDLHRTHPLRPLLAELSRLSWVERIELPRLSRLQADELAARILGYELAPSAADEVHRRAEGNPLFVEELLSRDGEPNAQLPESLRDLLLAAVHRLPEETQDVLRAASAAGPGIKHPLLAAVTGLEDDALASALRPAVAVNVLVVRGDGYAFRHALIREAVYDDLLPGERTRRHTRFAEALRADPGLVAPGRAMIEEAHHWYNAHDTTWALISAWHAAADARHALAAAEQLTLLARVLELWDKVPDAAQRIGASHLAVLEQAAEAAQTGAENELGISYATAALKEVDAQAEPLRAAVLLETRGHLRCHQGQDDGAADLRAALELVPPGRDDAVRARVLLTLGGHVPDRSGQQARAAGEEALALAQKLGDPTTLANALSHLALNTAGGDPADDTTALELLARARTAADQAEGYQPRLEVTVSESHILEGMGRHEDAARVAQAGIAGARDQGLPRATGALLAVNVAEPLVSLGRWDEAIEVIEHALALAPPPATRGGLRVLAGLVTLRRGDVSTAADLAVAARASISRERHTGKSALQFWLPLTQFETELRLAQGGITDAVAGAEDAVDTFDLASYPRYSWPVLAAAARACAAAAGPAGSAPGDAPAAQAGKLLGRLRALAETMSASGPVEQANHLTFTAEAAGAPSAALAGPAAGRAALARWNAAAAAWDSVSQPYPLAVALLRAAEAALTAGDRDDATRRLRRAAELADSLGAHPLSEEIGSLARNGRIALTGRAGGDRGGGRGDRGYRTLTSREFEVLRYVAAGRSNPEIAAKLFISAKTVSVHVSNILTKLGVSSRGEAAAAAYRLRLFDPGADGTGS